MTKRRTTTRKPATPKATKAQVQRIDELGRRIYAFNWARAKEEIVPANMTKEQARKILYEFDTILGGE
jgi:hypothetical protein